MRVLGAILTICSMLVFTSVQAMATDAGPRVLLQTSKGNITIELNEAKAPISVANFLTYVRDGHYAGTVFHRVIKGFMIQGGGLNKQLSEKITHASIRNEADNGLRNDRGTIAMARTGDPHSATSQFFINLVDNGFLNHRSKNGSGWGYAVFGKVIEGMDIVDAIAAVKTISRGPYGDVPAEPIIINKVTIVQ